MREMDFQRRVAAYEAGAGFAGPGERSRLTLGMVWHIIRFDPLTAVDGFRWVMLWMTAIAVPLIVARNSVEILVAIHRLGWDERLPAALISGSTIWALSVGIGTPLLWLGVRNRAQRIRHAALGCSLGLLVGLGPQLFVEGVVQRLLVVVMEAAVEVFSALPF